MHSQIDPASLPHSERYKLLIGAIVPRPIAWVSTINLETGVTNLAPFSYFSGVCNDPMTILFCPVVPGELGSKKDTLRNIEQNGEFVVNIASEKLATALNLSAAPLSPELSEFEYANVISAASYKIRPPRVLEAPVSFECVLRQIVTVNEGPGGGFIVIGEVVHIHLADGIRLADGNIAIDALNTFGRLSGDWFCRTSDRFQMKRQTTVSK